eukprot:1183085-Prorocentrum_minimum.AAC.3
MQNVTDHMQRHGIKKPTVQKVLDDLAEKGLLVVKVCTVHCVPLRVAWRRTCVSSLLVCLYDLLTRTHLWQDYNKTKIYHASQTDLEVLTEEVSAFVCFKQCSFDRIACQYFVANLSFVQEKQEAAQRMTQLQQEITDEQQVVAVLEKRTCSRAVQTISSTVRVNSACFVTKGNSLCTICRGQFSDEKFDRRTNYATHPGAPSGVWKPRGEAAVDERLDQLDLKGSPTEVREALYSKLSRVSKTETHVPVRAQLGGFSCCLNSALEGEVKPLSRLCFASTRARPYRLHVVVNRGLTGVCGILCWKVRRRNRQHSRSCVSRLDVPASVMSDEIGIENDASSGVDGDQMQKVFDDITRSNKINGMGSLAKVARRC